MLTRIRKAMDEREGGFTLIELLVVIIIIGILAAIAIPTFLKQREKGYRADLKSSLKNAATATESYATETGGDYTSVSTTTLATEGFKHSATVAVTVPVHTSTRYCLQATDTQRLPGVTYSYDSNTGAPVEGACT
jgi:type IV pilus assembly protein PilA